MNEQKRGKMIDFWSGRARAFGQDPRANTNDVWLREVEIRYVDELIRKHAFRSIVDFGCANGFSTLRLAELHGACAFHGIDINPDMIGVARSWAAEKGLGNAAFSCQDVLSQAVSSGPDFIYAIRVFQNIESEQKQRRVADRLCDALAPGGRLLTIESYTEGYKRLNDDRIAMGLAALPIHEHLTLLGDAFDDHIGRRLNPVSKVSLSSSYYLVTRLLYSALAAESGEPIDYNHAIHRLAAFMPQIGDYGPQRACLYIKA